MTVTIGTSGGNKAPTSITVGTSGGNKAVVTGYVGTSGGNKVFFSPGPVGSVTISDTTLVSVGGTRTATITFSSDGYASGTADTSGSFSNSWFTPPATNIGTSYEIQCTSSGDGPISGAATGSWISLSTGRSWSITTATLEKFGILEVEIRDTATSTVVGTATYILNVSA